MEARELMLDDFVYHKVKNIDGSFRTDIEQLNEGILRELLSGTSIYFSIEDYSPIPLTAEILEKNGWIQNKYSTCKSIYEYKGLHLHHTMIKRSNGRWVANVDGQITNFNCDYDHSYLRINIHYVHELQHALRLCGLNDLADNFNVD